VGTETKNAFQGAFEALREVPAHPMRGLLLQNYGFVLCLRADYEEAFKLAEETAALPGAPTDTLLQLALCTIQGEVHLLQGRPNAARAVIETALPVIEHVDVGPDQSFAQVVVLGLLALELLQLGLAEQSAARIREAYEHAERLGLPMGTLVAAWSDALREVRLGDVERVGALADDMLALVEVHGLAHGRAAGRWFRGWADARRGHPMQGFQQIRAAWEDNRRLGMFAGSSETLGYAAEALVLAGQWDAAQQQLDEAFKVAELHRERVYRPQLMLIEAAIARGRGQSAAAAAAVRRSIAEARAQEARWLELLGRIDLCESGAAGAKERAALAALLESLPECRHTHLFQRGRAAADRPSKAGKRPTS
jgi:tetratricopeptide (TPR) repeat protein